MLEAAAPPPADTGVLKYLQFYNLTCNDCGGWRGARCVNGTSCTLPVSNCTCEVAAAVPGANSSTDGGQTADAAAPAACNYTQFS